MNVLFSQPWMLLGLAAAALPLLVHLFFRQKPKPRPFGPMALLLASSQRTVSLWRLRRLLVYALRTLLLLALALALARPWLEKGTLAAGAMQGEAATALVLDASFSMRYAQGKHSAFEAAKTRALEVLEALSEAEPVGVVLCDGTQTPPPPLSHDKTFWRRHLKEARPSFLPATLNSCMETAAKLLQESPMEAKRLVVFSDFARHALHMGVAPPQVRDAAGEVRLPQVVLHPLYEGKEAPQNRALLSLEAESLGEAGLFEFVATVQNFGPRPQKEVELQLRVGGETVQRGFVVLAAHGSARKTFSARLRPQASHEVEVRMEADGLPEDDAQSLWLKLHREQRVLLVDGAPSVDRQSSESYFVELALAQLGQARMVLRDSQAAWRENFSHYTAVFLLNVPAPPPEVAAALQTFVEAGGGLWVSLGDNAQRNMQLEAWNQAMGELLPRPLRWIKGTVAAPEAAGTPPPGAFATISQVENTHPVLQPFLGEGLEGLLSARFFRHALLEAQAEAPRPMQVLLQLDDGAPLLTAHSLGKGQVLTFVSSADRDWNDLPLRTAFVPLLQRSAQWLSGSLLQEEVPTASVGQTLRLPAPQPAYVGPYGEEAGVEPEGTAFVRVGPLVSPGLWWPQGGDAEAAPLLVKPLPQESDLTLLDMEEVRAWFGSPQVVEGSAARRWPLWTALLLLALAALCMEMGLLLKP
jgi:hypothetical protein